jgi:hypothetical protein
MPNIKAKLLDLFGHAGAAITAKCKAMLLAYVRQDHKIDPLALAHAAGPPGPVTPR